MAGCHFAEACAARAVAAGARQTQIREAGGFEDGQRIGRFEALAKRLDANERRAGWI
jgi:hypothetical protein